jgi:hypothetical protein
MGTHLLGMMPIRRVESQTSFPIALQTLFIGLIGKVPTKVTQVYICIRCEQFSCEDKQRARSIYALVTRQAAKLDLASALNASSGLRAEAEVHNNYTANDHQEAVSD